VQYIRDGDLVFAFTILGLRGLHRIGGFYWG
jgi:hypothetical protein